jgi:hypothetical protein
MFLAHAPAAGALPASVIRELAAHLPTPADRRALSLVARAFRAPAQIALFEALVLRAPAHTIGACALLMSNARIAGYVDALALFVGDDEDDDDEPMSTGVARLSPLSEGDEDNEDDASSCSSMSEDDAGFIAPCEPPPLPNGFWHAIGVVRLSAPSRRPFLTLAQGLRALTRLRFLTIYLGRVPSTAHAYILRDTTFSLRSFHCDLAWDADLAAFLETQARLADLYIGDFGAPRTLSATALPALAVLECTFTEAAAALVPDRPVTHLKTCLSAPGRADKDAEVRVLASALAKAARPLRSLDIADSTYEPLCGPGALRALRDGGGSALAGLRYVGTLALPVGGDHVRPTFSCLCVSQRRSSHIASATIRPPSRAPASPRDRARGVRLASRADTRVAPRRCARA